MAGLLPLSDDGSAVVIFAQGLVMIGMAGLLWWSGRKNRKRVAWRDEMHHANLAAVADHADRLAVDGLTEPGTRAVVLMFPGFDFTDGGRVADPRGTAETRAQEPQKWEQSWLGQQK